MIVPTEDRDNGDAGRVMTGVADGTTHNREDPGREGAGRSGSRRIPFSGKHLLIGTVYCDLDAIVPGRGGPEVAAG
jgi:hypothetical protein